MGDSTGHDEGDELVVDAIGVEVGPLAMVEHFGTPHSEALHVIERYRLVSGAEAKEAQEQFEKSNGRVGGAPGLMAVDPDPNVGSLQLRFTAEDRSAHDDCPGGGECAGRAARGAVLAERHRADATAYAVKLHDAIMAANNTGARTTRQIAVHLNEIGVTSREGR
jgi:hypothetical protein